jgi:hypothetical protein
MTIGSPACQALGIGERALSAAAIPGAADLPALAGVAALTAVERVIVEVGATTVALIGKFRGTAL